MVLNRENPKPPRACSDKRMSFEVFQIFAVRPWPRLVNSISIHGLWPRDFDRPSRFSEPSGSPPGGTGVNLSHFPSVDLDLILDLDVVVDPFLFVQALCIDPRQ